ncbi:TRAP transporter large permease subunit [Bordetella trematum]|uniref:TRAP transporter large permease n=1 Tax=Bordetella trematum TaxID=123899 RepID=UPI0014046A3C|nr:TRAP transporter large permease subunit [Bordetella trematum]QIM72377.1 TRAP transporter large permease subunit [Bordetella trematum]
MNLNELLCLLMFAAVMATMMAGFPVAFTLSGVGIGFALLGSALEVFEWRTMGGVMGRLYGIMSNEMLVAIPLFVFMGFMLEKSKTAERLLETTSRLFGTLSGGLAFTVVAVGTLLSAATGMVAATVATLALISIPAMRRAGYQPAYMAGTVCASGALSQLIPPSTVLILIGDMMRGVTPASRPGGPVTVSDLFAGAVLPSLLVVGLFFLYVLYKAIFQPATCPPLPAASGEQQGVSFKDVLRDALAPLSVIVAVLGSILGGIATPTESAAVGAAGATVLALISRSLSWCTLKAACQATGHLVAMVYTIMIGAAIFSLVFKGMGGEQLAHEILASVPGSQYGALILVLAIAFVLGFFLDSFEIIFIVIPIFGPPLIALGVDPLLFGVLLAVTLQTSYLTPPFGFAVFYLQGVFKDIDSATAYRGVLPYIFLQALAIAAIMLAPALATWLPAVLY